MKFAVLGATGRTGLPLVRTLLDRGHDVAVLVRDPAKLGQIADRVTVVTGESRDKAALDQLLIGADAVISTLGPTAREASLHTDTAKALGPRCTPPAYAASSASAGRASTCQAIASPCRGR